MELITNNNNSNYASYEPKQAFLATWEDIIPYSAPPLIYDYEYLPFYSDLPVSVNSRTACTEHFDHGVGTMSVGVGGGGLPAMGPMRLC